VGGRGFTESKYVSLNLDGQRWANGDGGAGGLVEGLR